MDTYLNLASASATSPHPVATESLSIDEAPEAQSMNDVAIVQQIAERRLSFMT
jgi:hypothetical protein